MSLRITLSGLDASATRLLRAYRTLAGFPAAHLAALYLCDDGEIGTRFTGRLRDETGYGRHATLVAGSTVERCAGGLHSAGDPANSALTTGPGADGFLFDTGIAVDGSFSLVLVAKLDEGSPAELNPALWSAGAPPSLPLSTLPRKVGLLINTSNMAMISPRLLNTRPFSDGQNLKTFSVAGPLTKRFAVALSYDAATGTWLMRLAGQSLAVVDKPAGDWMIGQGSTHAIGYARGAASDPQVDGEIGLAALYAGVAMDESGLDTIIMAAKAAMAARAIVGIV